MRTAILTALLTLQSSCSLIPNPDDKLDRFLLDSTPTPAVLPSKTKKPALIIDTPTLYAPLDNTRIAIKPSPSTIDYIADVEWADRLGTLIHESMIQSAQNSGYFEAVGRMNTGLQSRHMLLIDVRQFHKLCCDKKVEVEYFVQLLDMQDRQVLASKSFTMIKDSNEESAKSIALTLNECHKKLTENVLSWCAQNM